MCTFTLSVSVHWILQADKDKIEEELKRLKQAESWVRRSSSPTSPSLSPSASVEELTAVSYEDVPLIMRIIMYILYIMCRWLNKLPSVKGTW